MARLEIETGGERGQLDVRVVLSRKNLLALLHKLDMPGSARELRNYFCFINGEQDSSVELILNCEDDEEHYHHPSRGEFTQAGEMHPDSEEFIRENAGTSGA